MEIKPATEFSPLIEKLVFVFELDYCFVLYMI